GAPPDRLAGRDLRGPDRHLVRRFRARLPAEEIAHVPAKCTPVRREGHAPNDKAFMTGAPLLQGLRVLDMTQVLSGPFCTQILADVGAEVIKLEPPAGDLARAMQPHFIGDDSVYFVSLNRNKRSLALDLKTPAGVALVRRLIARCDVVVENNRPGVL